MSDSSKNDSFEPDEKFWETWRGRVVRAIVLNTAYAKETILKNTSLSEKQFEQAIKELREKRAGFHSAAEAAQKSWFFYEPFTLISTYDISKTVHICICPLRKT
jgi:hypothetical protein